MSYLPQVRSWLWLSYKVTESCILLLACLLMLVKTRFRGPTLLVVPRKPCHAPVPAVCQAPRSPSCSPLCLPAEQFHAERSHPQKALSHFFSPPLDGKENFFPEMDERNERVGVGSFGSLTLLLFPRVAPAGGSAGGHWEMSRVLVWWCPAASSALSTHVLPSPAHPCPCAVASGWLFPIRVHCAGVSVWPVCTAPLSYLFWSWFFGFCV